MKEDLLHTPLPEPRIWSSILRNLRLPMKEQGVDIDHLLRQCGISPEGMDRPNSSMPLRTYLEIMETAAKLTNDPLLGIKLAKQSGAATLGALGFLFLSAHTLYEGLSQLHHFINLVQDSTVNRFSQEGNELWYSYETYNSTNTDCRQDVEFTLSVTVQLIRLFSDGDVNINAIHFRHQPGAPVAHYERLLGAKCFFEQEVNLIRFPKEYGVYRGKLFEPELYQILKNYLDSDLTEKMRTTGFSDQIRRAIFDSQVAPPVTAQKMARYLGISSSTLNRRLRAEGITFKSLTENISGSLAIRLLKDTTLTITQVSQMMGFSNTSGFTRAFVRWNNGITPTQFRRTKGG
ncbi:AraC family transcriptional regulator [Porticoccus sp. GXU_MW_L64]